MEIKEIKKLLHHREPYLLIKTVIEHSDEFVHAQMDMKDHPLIPGHFPGAPIVPGAMQQEMCTQAAGVLITKYHSPVANYDSEATPGYALGVLRKVKSANYLSMVKLDSPIDIKVKLQDHKRSKFDFIGYVSQKQELKAEIHFQLVNIPSDLL